MSEMKHRNTPQKRPALGQLRVAAYCRVASDSEENTSFLDQQRIHYTEQIHARPDWTMVGIFTDTGNCHSKCPEFQKMLRKCRQGKIDLILVSSISRFSRSLSDCLSKIRSLREMGVTVFFEKENISAQETNCDLFIALMDEFAKAECEHLTHNSVHTLYTIPNHNHLH